MAQIDNVKPTPPILLLTLNKILRGDTGAKFEGLHYIREHFRGTHAWDGGGGYTGFCVSGSFQNKEALLVFYDADHSVEDLLAYLYLWEPTYHTPSETITFTELSPRQALLQYAPNITY